MNATNKGYWGMPPLLNPSFDAPRTFALSVSMDFGEENLLRAATTTLDTSLLRRGRLALSYVCTACGFAPRLNRKSTICWVVLAALKSCGGNCHL